MLSEGSENGLLKKMIFSRNIKFCKLITLSVVKYTETVML